MVSFEVSGLWTLALLRSSDGFKAAIWACLVEISLADADSDGVTPDAADRFEAGEHDDDGEESWPVVDIAVFLCRGMPRPDQTRSWV